MPLARDRIVGAARSAFGRAVLAYAFDAKAALTQGVVAQARFTELLEDRTPARPRLAAARQAVLAFGCALVEEITSCAELGTIDANAAVAHRRIAAFTRAARRSACHFLHTMPLHAFEETPAVVLARVSDADGSLAHPAIAFSERGAVLALALGVQAASFAFGSPTRNGTLSEVAGDGDFTRCLRGRAHAGVDLFAGGPRFGREMVLETVLGSFSYTVIEARMQLLEQARIAGAQPHTVSRCHAPARAPTIHRPCRRRFGQRLGRRLSHALRDWGGTRREPDHRKQGDPSMTRQRALVPQVGPAISRSVN